MASNMSAAVAKASRLKPDIRLAQAVSQFEADLSKEEKDALRTQKASSPPDQSDVMRLTSEFDKTSGIVAGRRCFGPRLTSFLDSVQQYAALGEVVVGGSQNMVACGVWMLVRISLLSIATYASYLDKLSGLFMDIGRSAPRYQALALLYPQSKQLQAYLAEYFTVIVGFCHQIWKFAQKSAVNRFVSALSNSDLRMHQSKLESWSNAIREEVDLLMAKKAHEDSREIAGIKTLVTKGVGFASHQRNLQTKLRVLDLCSTYDFQTTWKQTRKIGHCSLLSQCTDYQSWKSQTGPSTLIYMGKLGSGKSVLLANIVDDLGTWVQNKPAPVAYFFCRHDILESLDARTVFGSLVRQLLLLIPDFASKELPDATTLRLDIEEISTLLQRVFPRNNATYIVLDGLDECDSMTRNLLVQQLQKLQKTIDLRLCISIRVNPATNQSLRLEGFPAARKVFMPDDNPDIEAYIDGELESLVSLEKLKLGSPVIILDIQKRLMEGSQGMFLWVVLQLQTLCMMKTDDEILHALDNLPQDLPETFTRILQRSGEQGKAYQRRILELVSVACRALTTEELREALSVVPGDTNWRPSALINDITSTLACCGGLVVVDEEEQTVRLVHHSFKQFLVNGLELDGAFDIALAHKTMAHIIVTYVNYGVFGTQLSTTVAPRMEMENAPSQIVRQTLGLGISGSLALRILKSRKTPGFDMGKTILDASNGYEARSADPFHFHGYAKSFWMHHVLYATNTEKPFAQLLDRLLDGSVISFHEAMRLSALSFDEGKYEPLTGLLVETVAADLSAKYGTGIYLLELVVRYSHDAAVVKLLLETAKVDVNAKDDDNMTPLLRAVEYRNGAVVQLLLETGMADVNGRNRADMTPLILAARYGYEAIVKLILETGVADATMKDSIGRTALDWANMKHHKAVSTLLQLSAWDGPK